MSNPVIDSFRDNATLDQAFQGLIQEPNMPIRRQRAENKGALGQGGRGQGGGQNGFGKYPRPTM